MESPVEEYEFSSKIIEKSSTSLEEHLPKITKQLWMREQNPNEIKILEPDDPLMKRFQDTLKAHLIRIEKKLSDEIRDLEVQIKDVEKKCETEGQKLYNAQTEVARQQKTLDNYQSTLSKVKSLYEVNDQQVKELKEMHKKLFQELEEEKLKEKKLTKDLENLSKLEASFTEWEVEINNNLLVSKRISEKDVAIRKELIQQKQQKDYILFKLMNEVHKIEDEIRYLDEQLQLKEKENTAAGQAVADANTDLEALQRDQKNLLNTWKSVLTCISQRDSVNDQLNAERRKIQESFQSLQIQIDKLKKDTNKEMERNEQLTTFQMRLEDDLKNTMKAISTEQNKIENLETQIAKLTRLVEQSQKQYQDSISEYQQHENEVKILDKDLSKLSSQKMSLEEEILSNLDDKVTNDKVVRHLNKLLRQARDASQEQELATTQVENAYAKNIYEIEKLKTNLENEESALQEIIDGNIKKEKEIDQMQTDIGKFETQIEQKQRKNMALNKKIEEIIAVAGEECNPLDLKIVALERSIEEVESKNQKLKLFWLRQEGNMIALSQQKSSQAEEISLLSKQITVMEQKNSKIEFEKEKQSKEKANIERKINLFQQRLVQINSKLVSQKDLKIELESKNYLIKNKYVKSLQDAETDLIKLENEIKSLLNEKAVLKDQLLNEQRESLSWEKKVQLAVEISKSMKEERSSEGDIGIMKSEIHKMEMRLSHLKKIQEKLILDMESCITKREAILDAATAKEKRNPKGIHNQRFILRKRMDDQKTKIKQVIKETKAIDNNITALETEQKKMLEKLNEGQKILRENEDAIPDIEKQITEAELIKYHNLELLVRKQRKASMLQEVKNGRYKMLFKSEAALSDEIRKQKVLNSDLKEIMNQTSHDFPLLKKNIRKILLTLDAAE